MELLRSKKEAIIVCFVIILYLTITFSCSRNKIIIPTTGIELIDSGRLVFDIKFFDKHKDIFYPNGNFIATYEYTDDIGNEIFMHFDSLRYRTTYKHPDSLFYQSYYYYPNGQLKQRGTRFGKGDFEVGKEFYYDIDGNVEKIIDHDTTFNYSLDYVFEFLKQKGVDLEDIEHIRQEHSLYDKATGELIVEKENEWRVYTKDRIWRIDGDTGEHIKERDEWIEYHN